MGADLPCNSLVLEVKAFLSLISISATYLSSTRPYLGRSTLLQEPSILLQVRQTFAVAEKESLGLMTKANTNELRKRLDGLANGNGNAREAPNGVTFQSEGNGEVSTGEGELIPGLQDILSSAGTEPSSTFVRKRRRKLSQSDTVNPRRQGKLASFEGAPPMDVTNLLEGIAGGVAVSYWT
ncbi:hypothetical protein FRC09_004048 [Ceratobasidium sp. 395]|nr:hypothetical protein FRC09_004048 [Ceratobasidium sp. 395]